MQTKWYLNSAACLKAGSSSAVCLFSVQPPRPFIQRGCRMISGQLRGFPCWVPQVRAVLSNADIIQRNPERQERFHNYTVQPGEYDEYDEHLRNYPSHAYKYSYVST